MSGTFANPLARKPDGLLVRARAIKSWTREILALPEDAVVSVNEIACALPDCPPKETIILVMLPDQRPRQFSLHMAIGDVERPVLENCLSEAS